MDLHFSPSVNPALGCAADPRWIDALIARATRLSRPQAWAATALAVVLTASASRAVGPDIWFGPLYLLIICLPAWTIGRRAAFGVGLCCAAISIAVNGLTAYPMGEAAIAWNLSMRMLAVAIIVLLVGSFRRSYDREWHRARRDELTGALSKQAFHEQVAASRRREWGVLVYVDLDGFKQVNDRYGHAAGDAALCGFVAGVGRHVRPTDAFARIGGDEFLLYIKVRDEAEGQLLAERLHARMNDVLALTPYPVRCSTGALLLEPGSDGISEADIGLADRLMYEAKREGRSALRTATRGALLEDADPPLPVSRRAA